MTWIFSHLKDTNKAISRFFGFIQKSDRLHLFILLIFFYLIAIHFLQSTPALAFCVPPVFDAKYFRGILRHIWTWLFIRHLSIFFDSLCNANSWKYSPRCHISTPNIFFYAVPNKYNVLAISSRITQALILIHYESPFLGRNQKFTLTVAKVKPQWVPPAEPGGLTELPDGCPLYTKSNSLFDKYHCIYIFNHYCLSIASLSNLTHSPVGR